MPSSETSIAQLSSLVDKLASLLGRRPEEVERLVGGQGAPAELAELWPGLEWASPSLDGRLAEARHEELRRRAAELEAELARRGEVLERARRALELARGEPGRRAESWRRRASELAKETARLEQAAGQGRDQAAEQERQVQALASWLGGVRPRGLGGYQDAKGRKVGAQALLQASRRLNEARGRAQSLRRRAGELAAGAARAAETRARLEARALAEEDQARRRAAELEAKAGRLERAAAGLEELEARTASARRRARDLLSLSLVHSRLVEAGRGLLAPLGAGPEPEEAPALASLAESLDEARRQGERCRRLAGLLQRQDRRLAHAAGRVTAALARSREANREASRLENELPELVGPLTDRATATPQARARAFAGLGHLAERVEELLPRARASAAELEELRAALDTGLGRGRAWVEAWKAAGRAQRAALDTVQALIAELPVAAEERRAGRRRLLEEARPVLEALAPAGPAGLNPEISAVAARARALEEEAAGLEAEAERLAGELPPVAAPKLSRPPAALKEHARALKRLSGKQVELGRLEALARTARRWREEVSRPAARALQEPLEQVAARLSGGLAALAGQRNGLWDARRRTAGLLARTRGRLRAESAGRRAAQSQLAELHQRHRATAAELAEARAELVQTRRDQALAWELAARLRQSQAEGRELGRRLARATRAEAALKAKSLERHRLLQETRRRLAASERGRARAEDGARSLGRRLAQARRTGAALKAKSLERHRLLQQARYSLAVSEHGRSEAEGRAQGLARRLAQAHRTGQALKAKVRERHGRLREARHTLEVMAQWRREAEHNQWLLDRTSQELEQARAELAEARRLYHQANADRDEAEQALAAERSARARQALDLVEGKALSLELAATQTEAGRWETLARELGAALALAGHARQEETAGLRRQIETLREEAAAAKEQLERIARMVDSVEEAGDLPGAPPAAPRPPRPGADRTGGMEAALSQLSAARRRLGELGRSTVGHWLSVALLTSGLVLVVPGTPSKANRTDAPLIAPKPPVMRQASQSLAPGPLLDLPARARRVAAPLGRGGVELNLLPIKPTSRPLDPEVASRVRELASRAGLAPEVLLTSARAAFAGKTAVEPEALEELAATAQSLARRHPVIFGELARMGLPVSAGELVEAEDPAAGAADLFLDRLYTEYRSLGFTAGEALGACAANERAAEALAGSWRPPRAYTGLVTPVGALEKLGLEEFLERMTPYIQDKLKVFLRQREMRFAGNLENYAKDLAFDMWCAAKRFQVPITFMMAIAHQETWYANVLGDADRSASPFQIYEPTRALIRASLGRAGFVPPPAGVQLQRHLTMATYMAAYHLRELMAEAYTPARGGSPATVDMDQVLKRYNGSSRYAGRVAKRQKALARHLAAPRQG